MATKYDVYLGNATDQELTGFMVHSGVAKGHNRYLVNSYAQKVGAGDRQYQDNASFDYWTVKDWSSGFGHKNPEDGFLYAHADTRFPEQALLPLEPTVPGYADVPHGGHDYRTGEISLVPESPPPTDPSLISLAASTFYNTSLQESQASGATVKIKAPKGATVAIAIHELNGRYPATKLSVASTTVTTDRPVAEYVSVNLPQVTLSAETEYAIVVSCDQEAQLYHTEPHKPRGWGQTVGRVFYPAQGEGQWAAYPYAFQFMINTKESQSYLALQDERYFNLNGWDPTHDPIPYDPGVGVDGDWFSTNEFGKTIVEFAKAQGLVHAAWGTFLDQWDEGIGDWVQVYDSGGPAITDIIELDDKIWIGLGGGGYAVFDPFDNSVTTDPAQVDLWHLHKGLGLLYRSYQNDVWYTNDAVTWTGPYEVCRNPYQIRGMASMGEYVYMACDDKLYYLGPGDFVHQLAKWPSIDKRNGLGMVEWTGNLYIPIAEDIVQYSETGVMLQMGLRVGEGLPPDLQGSVYQLLSTNYFLLAIVDPPNQGASSIWAYNQQGWHNICRLPQGIGAGALYLDTSTNWLWIGSGLGAVYRATYPSAVINPIRDFSELTFCREGWVEFDEFDGRLLELLKDAEAVYINGEFIGEACCLGLYWMEEDDTDWQFLGRVDEDHVFTRWQDYTSRPEFRTLRLGFSFRTDNEHASPIIRAHMLKFLAIATDRFGWQIRLLISDYDEDLATQIEDDSDTRAAKRQLLDDLERSVHPIIYQDINGQQYEARITAANMRTERYENTALGGVKYDSIHILTIEQVTFDPYGSVIPVP